MMMDNEMDAGWFDADAHLRSFPQAEWDVSEPMPRYGSPSRQRNPVVEETYEMASMVMDYAERLSRQNTVFADQILRSGTAVGSHTREAQGAESLADFYHKMKIAAKELEETDYRLDLCHGKAHYPHDERLRAMVKKLFPLFSSILSTTKQRIQQRRTGEKGRSAQ